MYINQVISNMWRIRNLVSIKRALQSYQYISDIHLNRNGYPRLKEVAANLIIAGDLDDGWSDKTTNWLRQLSPNYNKIFVVLGNHEYYDSVINKSQYICEILDRTSNIANLTILDDHYYNTYFDQENNIILYGTTLWSHIPSKYHFHYQKHTAEFDRTNISIETYNELHRNAIDKLEIFSDITLSENVFLRDVGKTDINIALNPVIPVIITHHAPMIKYCCHQRYFRNRLKYLNHMYCSDLVALTEKFGERYNPFWIFGHTHYHTSVSINNVFLGSNPIGLPKLPKNREGPKANEKTLYDLYLKCERNTRN